MDNSGCIFYKLLTFKCLIIFAVLVLREYGFIFVSVLFVFFLLIIFLFSNIYMEFTTPINDVYIIIDDTDKPGYKKTAPAWSYQREKYHEFTNTVVDRTDTTTTTTYSSTKGGLFYLKYNDKMKTNEYIVGGYVLVDLIRDKNSPNPLTTTQMSTNEELLKGIADQMNSSYRAYRDRFLDYADNPELYESGGRKLTRRHRKSTRRHRKSTRRHRKSTRRRRRKY